MRRLEHDPGVKVALVHDYLTQRGGAERAVLAMLRAFPGAAVHTSLYEPDLTFPEFREADVRTTVLNRVPLLRRHHRLALPLLAPAFSRLRVDADVALCSSSGWAHGAQVRGRKIVYCYTPARWLYQADAYVPKLLSPSRAACAVFAPSLRAWDRRAAQTAHRYLAISRVVQSRIASAYGHDAEVLPCPAGIESSGPRRPVGGIEPGFFLVVSRLLPYKNVGPVVEAFRELPGERLVVVGAGPLEHALRATAGPNVIVQGLVEDELQLRWLYANCRAVVAAAFEDQGLIPVEAAGFAKPTAALRWGGFLDTVVEGATGLFFAEPQPSAIADAVRRLGSHEWRPGVLTAHADRYSEKRFIIRLRAIVAEELSLQE